MTLAAADPKRDPLGHALVVVGYEDDPMNPGEGWFLLQNSWGTEWGDGGYGKISYGDFSRRCVEAGALVAPRRRGLFAVLFVGAALALAGVIALVAAYSRNRPETGPDWWTDAPWTNGTLNVCADISKGAYYTCPLTLHHRLFGAGTNVPSVAIGRCMFGVETLDLSSTHVLLLLARAPHENYTPEQKQVIRLFLEEGGAVVAFLCECNFDCMGDLLSSYGLKLHRQARDRSPTSPPTRRRYRFAAAGRSSAPRNPCGKRRRSGCANSRRKPRTTSGSSSAIRNVRTGNSAASGHFVISGRFVRARQTVEIVTVWRLMG